MLTDLQIAYLVTSSVADPGFPIVGTPNHLGGR